MGRVPLFSRCSRKELEFLASRTDEVDLKANHTLIKQGAKLTATWEDVWEELPTAVRLALTPATRDESQTCKTASLFGESELPPHGRKIPKLLKADESY